jgi:hypothetical protein
MLDERAKTPQESGGNSRVRLELGGAHASSYTEHARQVTSISPYPYPLCVKPPSLGESSSAAALSPQDVCWRYTDEYQRECGHDSRRGRRRRRRCTMLQQRLSSPSQLHHWQEGKSAEGGPCRALRLGLALLLGCQPDPPREWLLLAVSRQQRRQLNCSRLWGRRRRRGSSSSSSSSSSSKVCWATQSQRVPVSVIPRLAGGLQGRATRRSSRWKVGSHQALHSTELPASAGDCQLPQNGMSTYCL